MKSSGAKSRLAGLLPEAQRAAFSKLLLEGVLKVLAEARLVNRTYVVSSDDRALQLARTFGAQGVEEEGDLGVNSAVLTGTKAAGSPEAILVIPSDLPLLRASEVKEVLRLASSGMDVVVAPSRGFDGTNALAFSPSSGLGLSYDRDSFWNHLASAARNQLVTAVTTRPGFLFDVDSPDDFRLLAGARTALPAVEFARRQRG